MKRPHLFLLFFILGLTACQLKDEKKVAVNVEKIALQAFTDTLQLDTFKIVLSGTESKNMSLLFTIISHEGIQIYKKEIKAEELLKSYLASADLKKEDEKIKFLNDEVNFFFEEEHFLIPAITEQEKPDNNTPDKAFYEELKASKLNGFDYRLGKDTKVYIAWSAKEQKVKVYYKCC